ncbi:DUF881 domain-containing protein [Cellulomonas sp. DKR-3]|uniref:DUF881 domain-containing protein n=1 Tax=Cellulomonas fulva TaxID=2835530 RepID=A0ABS5TWC9_9CELL|nr:DUF881 domain-containing protein [Cellulomonas fulva]MBT0993465.1 DUF881 domain-containing protein [Cellulomonas fulva]
MTEHPHRRRRLARGTLSVAVVLALSGALFAANAKFARSSDEARNPEDLAGLTSGEVARVDSLTTQVDDLRGEVDALTRAANTAAGNEIGAPGTGFLVEGGQVGVTGPGVTVTLDDAPQDQPGLDGVSPDVLVVHQQDIQAVMNALWSGGAEAMALMDQRVISTSAFRCVGNVLRLQGQVYSPPYTVRAVGDPERLRQALELSTEVSAYRADAATVGLGWDVANSTELDLPPYAGATELQFATVPDGTTILPGLPTSAPSTRSTTEGTESVGTQAGGAESAGTRSGSAAGAAPGAQRGVTTW